MKNPDMSFTVYQSDENLLHVHALLFGPPSTPYGHGMFDFTLGWPSFRGLAGLDRAWTYWTIVL